VRRAAISFRSRVRALVAILAAGCASSLLAQPDAAFGMRLRPTPGTVKAIHEPAIIREAPTNEACLIARRDGTLEIYSITKPASDSVSVIRSRDGGLAWSEPRVAFPLPGKAYYAVQVLEATDGALHAVTHILGEGPGGYRGRLYEIYYAKKTAAESAWSTPQRIVPGYIGSIRGFIQLSRSGRLVLAVARAIPEREKPPATGPDFGWHNTFVYFSDDQGATWQQSPDQLTLELKTANATRYGAIEPALLELRDGRVWVLVRDRGGRLWQSFSIDGERWPALERSPFISSDSPAALLRLRDGKIVVFINACQNWSDPRSYAMGGREVLHAAISADEGKSWRGFREILHEPTVATRGDRGTAYASAAENTAGKIVVVSGQGEGKRAILAFDPRWLEATEARDDLAAGPCGWTHYGGEGLRVEPIAGGARAVTIPVPASRLGGASWNFPLADAGELKLRVQISASATGARLCLNDHFTRVDDHAAAAHTVFNYDAATLADARWHDVTFRWNNAQSGGELRIEIDGKPAGQIKAQRPAQFGVNTLRVESRTTGGDGRISISHLTARVR
jgi:hypothetical protein